ncbi:MAG: hypothetical protein ACM3TT_08450 [Syntrophothermus sp.]
MTELFEETERLKLRLIGAYEKMCEQGRITEKQLESIIALIDRIDEYSREEVEARLRALGAPV